MNHLRLGRYRRCGWPGGCRCTRRGRRVGLIPLDGQGEEVVASSDQVFHFLKIGQ